MLRVWSVDWLAQVVDPAVVFVEIGGRERYGDAVDQAGDALLRDAGDRDAVLGAVLVSDQKLMVHVVSSLGEVRAALL